MSVPVPALSPDALALWDALEEVEGVVASDVLAQALDWPEDRVAAAVDVLLTLGWLHYGGLVQ